MNIVNLPNIRYEYDMSFVSEEVPLRLADRQIQPLYKHLVHTRYPTLAVIGVPIRKVERCIQVEWEEISVDQ